MLLKDVVTRKAKFHAKNPVIGPQKALIFFGDTSLTINQGTPPIN
jgi:hypothetical protein